MRTFDIQILPELKEKMPKMALGTILCEVENTPHKSFLWKEIERVSEEIRGSYQMETIKTNKQIEATRQMYLACGKKPSRYRPSSEALMRRVIKGMELYQINTLVDLVNLVSLKTGYSIGGFDADLIEGDLAAGIGNEGEPYEGIGRGPINIYQLPVLRDAIGAIGTPTSDEVRTALRPETKTFFMNINGYTGVDDLNKALDYTEDLLNKFTNAKEIVRRIIE